MPVSAWLHTHYTFGDFIEVPDDIGRFAFMLQESCALRSEEALAEGRTVSIGRTLPEPGLLKQEPVFAARLKEILDNL